MLNCTSYLILLTSYFLTLGTNTYPMKQQIRIFFTALMFYSRIPCPKWVDHSEDYLNKATRYFPLIGWIVGGFASLFFVIFYALELPMIGLFISMIASIWITGAFHEDGFADVCDGFGGGWTKEKILKIMKDSQIGAYGAIGLILILGLKFMLLFRIMSLNLLDEWMIVLVLLAGHAVSRFTAATFIYTHEYSREDATSKVKPVSKNIKKYELIIAGVFGLLPLFMFKGVSMFVPLLFIPLYFTKWLLGRYFQKWIEGYTGDCLGATQQVTEVVFYLSFLVLWTSY